MKEQKINADSVLKKTRCIYKIFSSRFSFSSLIFVSVLLVTVVIGCSKRYSDLPAFLPFPVQDSYNYSVGRFKTSYLADQIHAYFRGHTSGPIAIATFVDIDSLYSSSSFGRLLSEQLMSELAMRGYNVIELRQSEALQVLFDQGEFGLSREIGALRPSQDISGLVVGTYVVSPLRIYINARIIDPATSLVVSVGSAEVAKTDEIDRLLRTNTLPPSLERIPVRNFGYASHPFPVPVSQKKLTTEDNGHSMEMMMPEKSMHGEAPAMEAPAAEKVTPPTPPPPILGASAGEKAGGGS